MKTDVYSHYLGHTNQFGFWLTKPHWDNYVAQVLKIIGIKEGESVLPTEHPKVIALLLDKRTNEIEEIVELAEPEKPDYIKLNQDFAPNYILPEAIKKVLNVA